MLREEIKQDYPLRLIRGEYATSTITVVGITCLTLHDCTLSGPIST